MLLMMKRLKIDVNIRSLLSPYVSSSFLFLDTRQKIETIEKIRQTRQQIRSEIQQLSERFRITQENLQRLRQISDPNDRHDVEHRTS